ncbi:MAG TPA: ubiquinone/menaquinone biosynthesis methyltransferase [Gemmatimonadales bacterium]|nr:ubiquinone/menaquinone biosynthesis methyltransferase [Gemmatimonadales bacterium]
MLASDQKLPVTGGADKRAYVREVFTAIAPTYDRLNRLLTLRLDLGWRRKAVAELGWERVPGGMYLDLCAGTFDFAAALASEPGFHGRIVGADFVRRMLELGRTKTARVAPVNADALELPFPDAAFDGAMIGWGVRNLVDLDAGLAEAARVVKPGGRLVLLEVSTPPWQPMRAAHRIYFERVVPLVGRWVSKHTTAYDWLPASARAFPGPRELARRLEAAGFSGVRYRLFAGGVTALHIGTR